jgi:copper resistance protein C
MRLIPIILITLALPLLGTAPAAAHAFLDHASPAVGSTVAHAPRQLMLWFTEKLEPAFSTIAVHNAQGAAVQSGKARIGGNGTEMHVALKPLPPGTYTVIWHALSVDTHRTQGTFSFSVGK